jgi:hypothetical protein
MRAVLSRELAEFANQPVKPPLSLFIDNCLSGHRVELFKRYLDLSAFCQGVGRAPPVLH